MELKNMAMSEEEAKEQYGDSMLAEAPKYSYGLQINLDDDAIEKLELPSMPKVGDTMMIHARVKVTSVSERESRDSDSECSMSLQITDMAAGPDVESKDASKVLYG